MTPTQEGDLEPRAAPANPWRLMAFPALAALFAAGVALALPASPGPEPVRFAMGAGEVCPGGTLVLPPGHPPLGGQALGPRDQGAALPPGHPPISRRRALRPAPPLQPSFDQPQIVDI